jgi:signal peptidase I
VGVHPLSRLPDPWRKLVDWLVTIAVAIAFVLVFQAEVAKPYRIPSSSMENTLHCARPGDGCLASASDRVLVNRLAYVFGSPQRGQIVVFKAPAGANGCAPGDAETTFVKRLIGLPGETVREDRKGFLWIRRDDAAAWRLTEPYLSAQGGWPT